MDLGTVSEKLGRGEYPTVIEAADDIELVWSNAMMYNGDDNWGHKAAQGSITAGQFTAVNTKMMH